MFYELSGLERFPMENPDIDKYHMHLKKRLKHSVFGIRFRQYSMVLLLYFVMFYVNYNKDYRMPPLALIIPWVYLIPGIIFPRLFTKSRLKKYNDDTYYQELGNIFLKKHKVVSIVTLVSLLIQTVYLLYIA